MFHISSPEAIKRGRTTDIYFTRAKEVLEAKGIKKNVTVEVTCGSLPSGYPWGVLAGIEEVSELFQGYEADAPTPDIQR